MENTLTKKINFRRVIAMAIATSMLLLFTGCGKTSPFSEVDPLKPDANVSKEPAIGSEFLTAEEWINSLEKKNFSEYEFTVVTASDGDFIPVDDGLFQQSINTRNEWVQNKFNVRFVTKVIPESSYYSEVRNAQQAGEYVGDLLLGPANAMSRLIPDGLLMNLTTLPYFNMSAEYVNAEYLKAATGENTVYMMVDSVSEYIGAQWCVFYDLALLSQLELEEPSVYVKNGSWTWEKFLQMAEEVAKLGDGYNGFASYADSANFLNALWGSSGVKFIGDVYKKPLKLGIDLDSAAEILDKANTLLKSSAYSGVQKQPSIESFKAGKTLFYVYRLDLASAIADNRREWSIVPLPKVNEVQSDYFSYVDQSVSVIGVPYFTQDSERTGIILNALFAGSYEHVEQAAKNSYINFYLRNNSSALMLNRIIESTAIDFTFLYGGGINSISNNTYELLNEIRIKKLNLEEHFQKKNVMDGIGKEAAAYFK